MTFELIPGLKAGHRPAVLGNPGAEAIELSEVLNRLAQRNGCRGRTATPACRGATCAGTVDLGILKLRKGIYSLGVSCSGADRPPGLGSGAQPPP